VPWACVAGATLLIPTGPTLHLHVVLNDPMCFSGTAYPLQSCALVNFSSVRTGYPYDPTYVAQPNCHPFIKHLSYVRYRDLSVQSESQILKGIATGVFLPRTSLNMNILKDILAGICQSRQTPYIFTTLGL
jgi:hypothetical protein